MKYRVIEPSPGTFYVQRNAGDGWLTHDKDGYWWGTHKLKWWTVFRSLPDAQDLIRRLQPPTEDQVVWQSGDPVAPSEPPMPTFDEPEVPGLSYWRLLLYLLAMNAGAYITLLLLKIL